MINSGMLVCSFTIKKRFSRTGNLYHLNECVQIQNHNYDDAVDVLFAFCQENEKYTDDSASMKMFSIDQDSIRTIDQAAYKALVFTINSGNYGIESEITDRYTGNVNYVVTEDDANIKKFRCLVYIPKDVAGHKVEKGILIFQTIASFGVKTLTCKQLKAFFRRDDMTFETRSVSARSFFEQLIQKGLAHKITLIKNRVSPDSSDNMLITSGREERSYYKPQLKENFVSRLLDFVEDRQDDDLFEINDDAFEDVKVTFKIGNSYRTVSVSDLDRFSVVEEFPPYVFEDGGFNDQKVVNHMIDTARAYSQKMVFYNQE